MKILFLHGWHSVVGGVKPTYLRDCGHEVINPALDDDDFEIALRTAQMEYDRHQPHVVVGSSRGGAIAMNIHSQDTPLVLLCPAWKRWGTVKRLKPNALILHSRMDDVIPFTASEELLELSQLPRDQLIEVGSDHRLADPDSLAVMEWACQQLTSSDKSLWTFDADRNSSFRSATDTSQEASYLCDSCGEQIVIPVDLSEGEHQSYVEDCPVCCNANLIFVEVDLDGKVHVRAEPEQDH